MQYHIKKNYLSFKAEQTQSKFSIQDHENQIMHAFSNLSAKSCLCFWF